MSVFAYTALNKDGRRTSGTLSAESRAAALSRIARDGLHPVTIDETADTKAAVRKAEALAPSLKVSQKAVESFTRELANLLAGGVPLARSLALLRREASNATARELWGEIHDAVVGGTGLGDALARYPRSFSTVYVAMVRAGEQGGFLDVVLAQIAEFRTREQDLKGKVKAAMIYPMILAFMAACVLTGLLTFFIPQFTKIFEQFGGTLPLLTRGIITVSNAIKRDGIPIAIVMIVGILLLRRALLTETGRRRWENLVLATPLLGTVVAQFALIRFARMLGTLVGAGVPLVASLRTARDAIGNKTLSDTVLHAIEQVQRGESLSRSLGSSPKLFPPSVVEMVAIAEETGRLDKELMRVSASYEVDLDRQLRMLVAVAEPLMLFVMAALIGTVVIGMLLPLLSMGDLIH